MDDLLHKPYIPEINDCFQLGRRYFAHLGINIRDYAFPSDFWEYDDDMYGRLFKLEGFQEVDTDGWKPQLHDVLLVPGNLRVPFATHIGILSDDNQVVHHFTGRLSEATAFKGIWRTPTRVLRHESLKSKPPETRVLDIEELMPDHVRRRIAAERA